MVLTNNIDVLLILLSCLNPTKYLITTLVLEESWNLIINIVQLITPSLSAFINYTTGPIKQQYFISVYFC